MARVDRDAPVRFLGTIFEPTDWAAIFLKSYERTGVAQRVGPVSWIQSERVQRWLRAMNARKYNVFVSVNVIASGRRSRTRRSQLLPVRDAQPASSRARPDPFMLQRNMAFDYNARSLAEQRRVAVVEGNP